MPEGAAADPAQAWWYSVLLQHSDFPEGMGNPPDGDIQRRIACFETLAQTVLMIMRKACGGLSPGHVVLEQRTDNAPTVGGINKGRSNAWPMALYVMHFALWAHRFRLEPCVSHVPGVKNEWADGLSRGYKETLALCHPRPALSRRFAAPLGAPAGSQPTAEGGVAAGC